MADKKMNEFQQVADAEYMYAEAADGSQVKIKKSDLANILKDYLGIINQTVILGDVGSLWYRIMEIENNSSAIFMLSLCTYINQPQLLIVGCVSIYDNNLIQVDFNKLVGTANEDFFTPNIKYKFENNKLVIWSKGSAYNDSYIYMLSGKASTYPMIEEVPPSDAITPTY